MVPASEPGHVHPLREADHQVHHPHHRHPPHAVGRRRRRRHAQVAGHPRQHRRRDPPQSAGGGAVHLHVRAPAERVDGHRGGRRRQPRRQVDEQEPPLPPHRLRQAAQQRQHDHAAEHVEQADVGEVAGEQPPPLAGQQRGGRHPADVQQQRIDDRVVGAFQIVRHGVRLTRPHPPDDVPDGVDDDEQRGDDRRAGGKERSADGLRVFDDDRGGRFDRGGGAAEPLPAAGHPVAHFELPRAAQLPHHRPHRLAAVGRHVGREPERGGGLAHPPQHVGRVGRVVRAGGGAGRGDRGDEFGHAGQRDEGGACSSYSDTILLLCRQRATVLL